MTLIMGLDVFVRTKMALCHPNLNWFSLFFRQNLELALQIQS